MLNDDFISEESMLYSSELEEPFLSVADPPRLKRRSALATLINIIWGGSLVGMLSAFVGLYCLDTIVTLPTKASMMWYSFAWSVSSAGLAYCIFFGAEKMLRLCKISVSKDDYHTQRRAERYFCVGVFIGFGLTCTIHDAANGFPMMDIALTGVAAALWATIMVVWATRGEQPVYSAKLPVDMLV